MSSGPSMPPFKTPPPMENGATTWRLAATPPHVYGSVPQPPLRSESQLLESTPPGWVAKVKATLLVMVAILVVWLVCTAIHDDWADLFLAWAEDHRSAASVSIVVLFIPVALMFVPVDVPLYLCAGFMYGFVRGSLLCWIGYNVGSWVGFYFGRWCFRDWLIETTKDQLHIQAIRAAVDDNSLVLVLLLQIAPIMPYSMVCYFFGASNCPFFPSYVIGTAIGVIPCVFFFVFIGSTMKSVAEATSGKAENSDQYWYFIYISSLVGLLTLVFISLEAKKQLDRLIGTSDANAVANRDAEAARPRDTATARTNASGARGLTTPHPTGRA